MKKIMLFTMLIVMVFSSSLLAEEAVVDIHKNNSTEIQFQIESFKQDNKDIQNLQLAILKLQPKQTPLVAIIIATRTWNECKKKIIDPELMIGLMFVESSLKPLQESSKGAIGLMQVRYSIWKEEPELKDNGVTARDHLFWIDENIKAGTDIFKKYYEESGRDIGMTLYRYNTGSKKLPEKTNVTDIKYVNNILYHAYRVRQIIIEEGNK